MCFRQIIPLLLFVIALSACQTEVESWRSGADADYERTPLEVPVSSLSIPIELPLAQLQKALHERLALDLVKNKQLKAGLSVSLVRNGIITLSGAGEELQWSVPLEISVRHSFFKGDLSRFKVVPSFTSQIDVQEDYTLQSATALTDIDWVSPAEIRVLGNTIDLTEQVDELIREQESIITELIDQELSKVSLKKLLGKTWSKLSKPIAVNKHVLPVFITVEPSELHLRKWGFSASALSLELGVFGHLNTVFDTSNRIQEEPQFPPLTVGNDSAQRNAIYLPMRVSYDFLNKVMREHVYNTPFEVEGRAFTLDTVSIAGVDSLLLITAVISGDMALKVEVLGFPHYIPETRTLSVSDFNYQVLRTDQSLLDLGDYFFHDEIIEEAVTYLNVPIGSLVDSIPQLISQGVERGKSGQNINLNAQLDTISIDQLSIGPNDMGLVIYARGEAALEVEKIGGGGDERSRIKDQSEGS